MSLKIECSNCHKHMGIIESDEEGISHGICAPCVIELYSDEFTKEEIQEICREEEIISTDLTN